MIREKNEKIDNFLFEMLLFYSQQQQQLKNSLWYWKQIEKVKKMKKSDLFILAFIMRVRWRNGVSFKKIYI